MPYYAHNYAYSVEFVPDWFASQKMCNKAVNTYPSTIQFNPKYYKPKQMRYNVWCEEM